MIGTLNTSTETQITTASTTTKPINKFMVGSGYIDRDELADLLMINLPRIIDYSMTSKNPYEHLSPKQAQQVKAVSGLFIDGIRKGTFTLKSNGNFNDELGQIRNSNNGSFDPVSFIERHLRNIITQKYELTNGRLTTTNSTNVAKDEFNARTAFDNYFISQYAGGNIDGWQDTWNKKTDLEKAKIIGGYLQSETYQNELNNYNYSNPYLSANSYRSKLNSAISELSNDTFNQKDIDAMIGLGINVDSYFSKKEESEEEENNDKNTAGTNSNDHPRNNRSNYPRASTSETETKKTGGILTNRINSVKKLKATKFKNGGNSDEFKREKERNKHRREQDKMRLKKIMQDEKLAEQQMANLKKRKDKLIDKALGGK
jgi:hypothetical protein